MGSPKPYNSRHLRLPEPFQNSLPPPVQLGTSLFLEMVPERASESCFHGIPSSTEGIFDFGTPFSTPKIRPKMFMWGPFFAFFPRK